MTGVGILGGLLAVAIGYVAGSFLPADLLARRRGVAIREAGDGNPGTINAFRVLGWGPGLLTAAWDLTVGVLVVVGAQRAGVAEGISYAAGVATVVGHRFPLFLGLRGGGQGMGASAGMLLYGIGSAVTRGWLSPIDIVGLAGVAAVTFMWTRSDRPVALVVLPALVARLYFAGADLALFAFMALLAGYVWGVQLVAIRRRVPQEEARPAGGHARG